MAIDISLKKLIESGAHFGHQSKRWNPKMEEYLFGVKDGVHVFDLTITKNMLEEALDVLEEAAKNKEDILIVGTKKQAKDKVAEVARDTNSHFITERWLGGTLTNFDQMRKSVRKLEDLKKGFEDGEFTDRTKKEKLLIEREITRLERFFGGVTEMKDLPQVLVVIDTRKEKTAIREAKMKGIKIIALLDSNSDPTGIDYPIPMNDDASRAIEYVLDLIKEAINEGKNSKETRSVKVNETKKVKKSSKTKKSKK